MNIKEDLDLLMMEFTQEENPSLKLRREIENKLRALELEDEWRNTTGENTDMHRPRGVY